MTFPIFNILKKNSELPTGGLYDGLVSYWKLDESPGSTKVKDERKYQDLFLNGDPTLGQTGKINKAPLLDGTDSFRSDFGTPYPFFAGGDYTISLWARRTALNGANNLIWDARLAGKQGLALSYITDNRLQLTTDASGLSTTPITDFNWHHIISTCQSNTHRLYLDNDSGVSRFDPINWVGSRFWIGANIGGSVGIVGQIDEFGLWNRVLTTSERTQLWNGGTGLPYNNFNL